MAESTQAETQQQQQTQQSLGSSSSSSSSPSNSLSMIKLDELSSYGATKQNRLPTLIKMNETERQPSSLPALGAEQLEQQAAARQQVSLPVGMAPANKENSLPANEQDLSEDFQMVDMEGSAGDLMGPSLPQAPISARSGAEQSESAQATATQQQQKILGSSQQVNQQPSYLGESLIDMIVNLRNENQNLVKALETNNDYVKERLNEFKRFNEEAKKREAQFAMERAEHEHQVRKLKRQNTLLSERLKSLESKLSSMKLEVGESLEAAHSSKASSERGDKDQLYPALDTSMDLADMSALNAAATMQVDATSGELYAETDPTAPGMETSAEMDTEPKSVREASEAEEVGQMSREELSKRFDAHKAEYETLDDPMKQCDKLEQQLNDIGKRDYEICLLQQQLNIYRQDFRLERMANLDAKMQIEKLKNDIDRLCLERLEEKSKALGLGGNVHSSDEDTRVNSRHAGRHARFDPASTAADVVGRIGHHISRREARCAAKMAKYAAKQKHREEKVAAAAAEVAARTAAAAARGQSGATEPSISHAHHRRGHHRGAASSAMRGLRNEVVSDLLSTANKAMLTGYKMASTHVNLAIDKLSAFEQAQAANLEKNKQPGGLKTPSAPPMGTPSLD